jgi:hypothetical protein
MANTKISALPTYTGDTTGVYLVMDNSGLTETYKVLKETLIDTPSVLGTLMLPYSGSSYGFGRSFVLGNRVLRAGNGTGSNIGTVQPYALNTNTTTLGTFDVPIDPRPTSIIKFYENVYNFIALGSNGYLYMYGDNTYGQIGDGTTTTRKIMSPLTDSKIYGSGITVVDFWSNSENLGSNGYLSVIVRVNDNGTTKYYGWGRNAYGQLGIGNTTDQNTPQIISFFTNFEINKFYLGSTDKCTTFALVVPNNGGTLFGTGFNGNGQLGNGTFDNVSSFIGIESNVTDMTTSAGWDGSSTEWYMSTYLQYGIIFACGNPFNYELGDNQNTTFRTNWTAVKTSSATTLNNIVKIDTRGTTTMALDNSGNLWSWGANYFSIWGNGDAQNTFSGYAKIIQSGVTDFHLNSNPRTVGNLFFTKNSITYCSGYNASFEAGTAEETNQVGTSLKVLFQESDEYAVSSKQLGNFTDANYRANIFLTNKNRIYVAGYMGFLAGSSDIGTGSPWATSIPIQICDFRETI